MKRKIQSIILLTGNPILTERLARQIAELGKKNEHTFLICKGEQSSLANLFSYVESLSREGSMSLIVTNCLRNIREAEKFFEELSVRGIEPSRICAIGIKQNENQKGSEFLAVNYMETLLRDGKGHAGSIVYESGNQKKALIDALGIMSNFDHKITVGGSGGSGKGTVTKTLKNRFGFTVHSAGDTITRPFAESKGYDIETFVDDVMKNDPALRNEYDELVDNWNKQVLAGPGRQVHDSRMGAFFSPGSFKVLCTVDDVTAGTRAFNAPPTGRINQKKYASVEEAILDTKRRNEEDRQAYIAKYGFDYTDSNNYNLVLDAVKLNEGAMAEALVNGYIDFLFKKTMGLVGVSFVEAV